MNHIGSNDQVGHMAEQMGDFEHDVADFGVRFVELRREVSAHDTDPLLQTALAELETAREELRVASEELQVQQAEIQAAKRSLDEARLWSSHLIDGLPVPSLETDDAGGISYANPMAAELLGLLRVTLVGKPLATYISVADRPAFRSALSALARGGDRQLLSLRLRRRRGSLVPVILSGSAGPRLTGTDALHWVAIPVAGWVAQVDDSTAERLIDSLVNLSMLPLTERSISQLLRQVAVLAVRALPEVDAATITLHTDQGLQRAAEPANAQHIADLEHTIREGPATTAAGAGHPQQSGNLARDGRWPEFGPRAGALGIQSVVAVPVAPGQKTQGVLMLLSRHRDAFADDAARRCMIFAEAAAAVAAVILERESSSREADQLLQALRSRERIEQAKGIIMTQRRCSPDEAFRLLVELSQRTNVKLRIVAERLVNAIEEAR
jgi:PAS domain S-box-containing protein